MILQVDDWVFDVDITATMAYSAIESAEHCTCAYCRNFYGSVDITYPQLRPVLAAFGADVEAPDELSPCFPPTHCEAYYAVAGRIVECGQQPITAGQLKLFPESAEQAMVNTFLKVPHFFLRTDILYLPWILNEPMEEVVSPANDDAFLSRTLEKLLKRAAEDIKQ